MPRERNATLPSDEKAKADRRLVRAIQSGLCMAELVRFFRSEARIRKVAEENGLTIAKGSGGRRL